MNGPQGLWVSQNSEVLYVLAARITFICAMTFEAFPLDVQTCLFQVSHILRSYNNITISYTINYSTYCPFHWISQRLITKIAACFNLHKRM